MMLSTVICALKNPPTSGAFFYSDYVMQFSKGFHSMTLSIADNSKSFYVSVSTN